jgi:hypothetical protein
MHQMSIMQQISQKHGVSKMQSLLFYVKTQTKAYKKDDLQNKAHIKLSIHGQ